MVLRDIFHFGAFLAIFLAFCDKFSWKTQGARFILNLREIAMKDLDPMLETSPMSFSSLDTQTKLLEDSGLEHV